MKIDERNVRARSICVNVEKYATMRSAKHEHEERSSCRKFDYKESSEEFQSKNIDQLEVC
jgi:hypothetical protein